MKGQVVTIRIAQKDLEVLKEEAEALRLSLSSVIRMKLATGSALRAQQ
jgi:predicted DNA binding CopG/RHH family protein